MSLVNHHTFPFTLDLLRANLQRTNKTDLLLALRLHRNNLARFQSVLCVGKTTTRRCQTGSHQSGAGKDEANSAAVDLNGW